MAVVIVRPAGEVAIKSARIRMLFIKKLINNIKAVINVEHWDLDQGYIIIRGEGDVSKLSKVFGISYYYPAEEVEYSSLQDLALKAKERFAEVVKGKKFAVRVRRVGKQPFTSLDVAKEVGSLLLPYSAGVDLENPEVTVHIDVIEDHAYFYSQEYKGPQGYPVGTTGKTIVLFSGGFDSPVATWMMMKRGVKPILLNVKLGGDIQKKLILEEVKVLREWSGSEDLKVYFVDGIKVTASLVNVPKYLRVVMLKRVMYKIADALGRKVGAYSITTGESLSQVSSQTMKNLYVTEYGIEKPVFRPLIGFDKEEIVNMARKIGTYELSAKMPEYCVISTKSTISARLNEVLESEKSINLDFNELIEKAEVVEI